MMDSDLFFIPEKLMTESIGTDLNKISQPTSSSTVLIQFESSTPAITAFKHARNSKVSRQRKSPG